jgi:large subunit ribosomal protein L10
MNKLQKQTFRTQVEEQLQQSSAVFVANYTAMTVEEITALRAMLRPTGAKFSVVKNTIFKKAIENREEKVMSSLMSGQTGVVFTKSDVAACAKALSEFSKKNEKFALLGGFFDNSLLSKSDVKMLADLPSREVLIGKILGSMVAPHKGMMNILQGVPRNMVQVLNAIKDKKQA